MAVRAAAPIRVTAAIFLTFWVALSAPAVAQPVPPPAEDLVPFLETPFGPRYVIEDVRVSGNKKTERSLIAGELAVLGLVPGQTVDASDRRVDTARYRLLSLGYFVDVHLSVTRGTRRGAVVLVVEVE